jgi:hypothetical protein
MSFSHQFHRSLLGSSLAVCLGALGTYSQSTPAIQLPDGTVHFTQIPRLVKATTTEKGVGVLGAVYYFTLSIPENSGVPLQRVTITQQSGVDQIKFIPKGTQAFKDGHRQDQASLGSVTQDKDNQTISVTFDPPIVAGKTVTIGLRPSRNPITSGTYLFGVTAFPEGEKATGQFLGFGRLQFYNSSNGSFR